MKPSRRHGSVGLDSPPFGVIVGVGGGDETDEACRDSVATESDRDRCDTQRRNRLALIPLASAILAADTPGTLQAATKSCLNSLLYRPRLRFTGHLISTCFIAIPRIENLNPGTIRQIPQGELAGHLPKEHKPNLQRLSVMNKAVNNPRVVCEQFNQW